MRVFGRSRGIRVVCAGVLIAVLLACGGPSDSSASDDVRALPNGLTLGGERWWPAGFNAYQLATDWTMNAGCGGTVDLDSYFGALPAKALTRFNLFAALAVDKNTGALDFSRMDAIFATAARYDQKLLPVLTASEGSCEGDQFKERGWYVDGWQNTRSAGRMTFEDWLRTAVVRWRHSSSLAGWEMVGEPEPSICGDASCRWQQRECPADAAQILRSFFDRAGDRLRRLDPTHPIWAGLTGGGQCGTAGRDYEYVARSSGVDVLDYHDYGSDGVPLPGDSSNGLAERLRQSHRVGKPLAVNEIGQSAGSCRSMQDRTADFRRKVVGQRAAGTATALFWAFVPDPRPGMCTYDIGEADPTFDLVAEFTRWRD
ncbi:beta-mannosidase [Gordonia soli]|uniref:beta-mannosidase n=1 Tax=Gordonia soli TaxID=320799 RepID=UPI000590B31B|nr:beta-mannosidase [Gordonia soli]